MRACGGGVDGRATAGMQRRLLVGVGRRLMSGRVRLGRPFDSRRSQVRSSGGRGQHGAFGERREKPAQG